MNIVLMTNTYSPHVGGVARSVQRFADAYRDKGHRVVIVAPEFPDMPQHEDDVFRIPAVQRFNASDFSVVLPFHTNLMEYLRTIEPDIIHSQHPFLLGMTAFRKAQYFDVPLVFTHHTLYEQYTHYIPGDSPVLKRFVIALATEYANLANRVFAPSESIRDLLVERGVTVPVEVIPTGIKLQDFTAGNGDSFRRQHGIAPDSFVVGHLGRLAEEKNLGFLARSVARFLKSRDDGVFLVLGAGPAEALIRDIFAEAGLSDRLVICGILVADELTNALHAMDLFAFASLSETQGMVLTEAMAAGLPVIALDASGVREVVNDRHNGRLLPEQSEEEFCAALAWFHDLSPAQKQEQENAARRTADLFDMPLCADKALACYETLCREFSGHGQEQPEGWEQAAARISAEWDILRAVGRAGSRSLQDTEIPGLDEA